MGSGTSIVRESDIEAYLVRRVAALGGLCYKWVSPGRAGVPDRIAILDGRVGFIELKAPGKKPTPLQLNELRRLSDASVLAWWADSREDIDEFLEELAQCP